MPVVSDNPTTIYVRDISEAEAFLKIKKKFKLTSNNETVKTLFFRYLELEKERNELKFIVEELMSDVEKKNEQLSVLSNLKKLLNSL